MNTIPDDTIQIATMNMNALKLTVETLIGDFTTFQKAYDAIDRSMFMGYSIADKAAAEKVKEIEEASKRGMAQASHFVEEEAEMAWDEGYCEGVNDARNRPNIADETIRGIIDEADPELVRAVMAMDDEFVLQRDSGDETDYESVDELLYEAGCYD